MIADSTNGPTITSLSSKPPPFTQQAPGAVLTVVQGPSCGGILAVGEEPIVIGSASSCDLVLKDPEVSRAHLQAAWVSGALHLQDLDSKNGSSFNGNRFQKMEARYGDEFRLGSSLVRVIPQEIALSPEAAEQRIYGALVGDSPAMRQVFSLIDQAAATDVPVIIEGETGVGKELIAEEMHRRSRRRDAPFVIFDCGAVPEQLVESVLFGHARGAFTGATETHVGIFAEADGGTVLLDEIGELKPQLQPALLRVLDRGMFRPVGATSTRTVDVRILAATHKNLAGMVAAGRFREDLYYRLAVLRISVPPLRERCEDIAPLIRSFLLKLGRPDLQPTQQEIESLMHHGWHGNVRELFNTVARGVATCRDGRLALDPESSASPAAISLASPEMAEMAAGGQRRPFREAKAEAVEAFERAYLTDLTAAYDNLTSAAHAVGMDRKHLRVLLRRYELQFE